VLWALAVTFASVDWAMSLDPHWFSSMYGVLFMAGEAVSGMAFALFAAIGLARFEPWNTQLSRDRRHDLGNLLLAFVLFWTYISLMQFLIIWSGNLPEETPWYLNRAVGGWQWITWVLTAFHFVIPFFLLLSKRNKRDLHSLGFVAALLLAMRFVELFWLVTPAFSPKALSIHWLHLVTPVAIGGLWVALFASGLASRAIVPVSEVEEEEAAA
jgi:hypothetical protein